MKTKATLLPIIFITLTCCNLLTFAQTQTWQWAKQGSTGTANDDGSDIAMDASGYIYVVGQFYSSSITLGTFTLTNSGAGGYDIFIAKYDPSGTVLWANKAGGTNNDYAYDIKPDASGNVFITGQFSGVSAVFGSNTVTNSNSASSEIFFAKYDAASGNCLAVKTAQGGLNKKGFGLAIDANGDIYITGSFGGSIDFSDVLGGIITITSVGLDDIFLAKLKNNLTAYWVSQAGGSGSNDYGYSVTVDAAGNPYITGTFNSTTAIFGTTTITNAGSGGTSDIFIAKYDGTTGSVSWAKQAGGNGAGGDIAYGIAEDALNGNVYITGYFNGTANFGGTSLTSAGFSDVFLAKYDEANGTVLSAQKFGNTSWDYANDVFTDNAGNVYMTGYFYGANIVFGSTTLTNGGTAGSNADIYVAKIDVGGTTTWAKKAGGTGMDNASGVVTNGTEVYVTGYFISANATFDSNSLTNAGSGTNDIFVAKIFDTALPIELLSFTGRNQGEKNILQWATATEIDNEYFVIERCQGASLNDKIGQEKIFEGTGNVKGAGNSTSEKNYSFIDEQPFSGVTYYRLKQVDYDGNFIYSKVISITEQRNTLEVGIYPNPAKDIITLDIGGNRKNMKTEVGIYDMLEREILKFGIANPEYAPSGKSEINVSSLSKGMYFLKVTNSTAQTQTKFVKE